MELTIAEHLTISAHSKTEQFLRSVFPEQPLPKKQSSRKPPDNYRSHDLPLQKRGTDCLNSSQKHLPCRSDCKGPRIRPQSKTAVMQSQRKRM